MIDVENLTRDPGETDAKFNKRIYNLVDMNLQELYTRKRGESSKKFFKRIDDYGRSSEARNYVFSLRDKETKNSHSFLNRKEIFFTIKKRAMEELESDVYKSLKRKFKEPSEDWYKRVEGILEENIFLINDNREEFNEPFHETQARVKKFWDIREAAKIASEIDKVKSEYDNDIDSKAKREAAKEAAKEDIRRKIASEREEEERLEQEEIEQEIKERKMFKLFLFLIFCLLLYFTIFNFSTCFHNSVMTIFSILILSLPLLVYIWDGNKEWGNDEIFDALNNNEWYQLIIGNFYEMAKFKS